MTERRSSDPANGLGTISNKIQQLHSPIEDVRLSPSADPKAVKGGGGPGSAIRVSNADFMRAAFKALQEGTLAVVCSKAGDPMKGAWHAEPAGAVDEQCPPNRNNYFNCSSFTPNADAKVTAQKIQFGAYHALVLDDVGTKVDRARLGAFVPSWSLETSPGNFQIGIILKKPLRESADVEALQSAIVAAGLCDAGAMGVSRWARLPVAINGKPKYAADGTPFPCWLHSWRPDVTYTLDEIVEGLGLKLPASPPLVSPTRALPSAHAIENAVFKPRPAENRVLTRLRETGLYKHDRGSGWHDITCPWVAEHTDQLDNGAAYNEPTPTYPVGGFKCHHSHGDQYHVGKLIDFLDVSPSEARNRPRIRAVAGELNATLHAAERALADLGKFYQAGGAIVSVRTNPHSGEVSVAAISEQALTSALAEAADWEKFDARSKGWVRCDPIIRIVNLLYKAETYTALPVLRGLARQPYIREEDGELVATPGHDPVSGKFASFDPQQFALGEPSLAGAQEALGRLDALLEEFHFSSDADRSAALCAMLTAAVRPTLPFAPAFNITAAVPGSGKSYLSKTIYQFAGSGEPETISYPPTSEEASKVILAILLKSPVAINFDDMIRNWEPHGVINRMLTSESISERILGVSKTVTVSTRTFVLGSGNNVEPLRDLRRRVISIRLAPQTSSPSLLSYSGKPAEDVQLNRGRYVSDALTIIQAWRVAGQPRADVFDIASFSGLWSDYCRQTLLWLGRPDPANSLIDQVQSDPDSDVLGDLLEAWVKRFGHASVTVRKILNRTDDDECDDFFDALEGLPVTDHQGVNRSKVGWQLKKQSHKIVGGLKLEPGQSTERRAWRVVQVMGELAGTLPPPFTSLRTDEPEKSQTNLALTTSVAIAAPEGAEAGNLVDFKWPPAGRP